MVDFCHPNSLKHGHPSSLVLPPPHPILLKKTDRNTALEYRFEAKQFYFAAKRTILEWEGRQIVFSLFPSFEVGRWGVDDILENVQTRSTAVVVFFARQPTNFG